MLLVTELLRWWYGDGLRQRVRMIAGRLDGTIDYFSVDLLLKTLFSPFRQIAAGRVDGSLEVQFRAMIDRLFSRVIGAFIRLMILVVGGIMIAVQVLASVIVLVVWICLPLAPVIGVILAAIGVHF